MGATVAFPAVRLGRAADTPLRSVVMLMRENRSFDHYFGHFPGADGLPAGAPVRPAAASCSSDPPHDEEAVRSIAGTASYTDPAALIFFGQRELAPAWALARRFTLCDRYFASVLGPTFPNRLFSVAASAAGYRGNPRRIDPALLPRPNLVDRLDAAGIGWACYLAHVPDARYNPITFYPERARDPRAVRSFAEFLADAAAGRLPAVSWVIPQDPLTEHPSSPPQWGQRFAALAVHAVASGPQWRDAAIVLNYDESGGFYDHVAPPSVDDIGYGFRVPCTVVSPYAKPGHVSHVTYDHASVLALVERTFGLAPLTARDAAADPMADCFDFGHPTADPIPFPAGTQATGCGQPPEWAAALLARPLPQIAPVRTPPATASPGPDPAELVAGLGGLGAALLAGAAIGLRTRLGSGRK